MPGETAPRVFISYSHDSLEHQDRVLDLADRLRADGIDTSLDQYEVSPPEGWPAWCAREIQKAEFVLMVCTETYRRRIDLDEEPGKGYGVLWEGRLIKQQLYNAGSVSGKFVPILFEDGIIEHIPEPVSGASFFRVDTPDGYEALYRLLTGQPAVRKPVLGNLRRVPERPRRSRAEPLGNESLGNETGQQETIAEPSGEQRTATVSNIPVGEPRPFLSRDKVPAGMDQIPRRHEARAASIASQEPRGIGRTLLAAEQPVPVQFDRIAATLAALVIIALAVFLLIRNEKIADPQLFFVLRVVLSLSAATLGATIPGFLELGWSGRGAAIRAGGALALFVLTFLYTPDLINDPKQQGRGGTTVNAPGGVGAGIINGGTFNIDNQPSKVAPNLPSKMAPSPTK